MSTLRLLGVLVIGGRLVGEGVEGAILVNAHGELIPIPSEYSGD